MKFNHKTIHILLFWGVLIIFSSCNGQNTSETKNSAPKSQINAVSLGDPVPEIDKGIKAIFQDSNENYWFGGDLGAYKYDGKSLVLFTMEDGLCSNDILGIQEDKLGNIYFDTSEGISKYDGQTFTTLEVVEDKAPGNDWKLESDDLWFRMGWDKNGPYRYDGKLLYHLKFPKSPQADAFHAKHPNVSFNPYGIYTLYKDSKGTVWLGTASLGVCHFDGKTISWLYEKQMTKTPSGGDFGIRSIIEDKEGYFWFCNSRYRYKIFANSSEMNGTSRVNYRKENGIGKPTDTEEDDFPFFMSIAEDNNGDLWMATYSDGVWRKKGQELIHYPIKDGEKDALLFSIYKDHQGILWLGTQNSGVYKYNGSDFEKLSDL